MSSTKSVTDEMSVVYVYLNITETNSTFNGTMLRVFEKRPNEDSSINNIIFGIGLVVVILLFILIIIKLIHKCYQIYRDEEDEDDKKENVLKRSPLLNSSSNSVRRNSSLRNPRPSLHRSSLNIETQMELKNKHLLQTRTHSPPAVKKA